MPLATIITYFVNLRQVCLVLLRQKIFHLHGNIDMNPIDFAKTVGKLKTIKRSGWLRIGIPNPESIADHVLRLTVLCQAFAVQLGVDRSKIVNMALIHDLGESLIGDLVIESENGNTSSKDEKYKAEKKAIQTLLGNLPDCQDLIHLWEEYEKQETLEAKILKQLDKFEMALQAWEYKDQIDPAKLEEFWANAKKHITHPMIKAWFNEIELQRGSTVD